MGENPLKKKELTKEQRQALETMSALVDTCQKLKGLGSALNNAKYDTNEVPTWYYSICKSAVNKVESTARKLKVPPSKLAEIHQRGGKLRAVTRKSKAKTL